MRSSHMLVGLILSGCAVEVSTPSEDEGDATPEEGDGSGTIDTHSPVDDDDDSSTATPPGGPWTGGSSPCDDVDSSSATCCWTLREHTTDEIVDLLAFDPSGSDPGVVVSSFTGLLSYRVSSLGADGATAYTCGGQDDDRLALLDLATGAVTSTSLSCISVATWQGSDSTHAGGITIYDQDVNNSFADTFTWYPSAADAAAGTGLETLGTLPVVGSRMTIGGDEAWLAWHSADSVEQTDLPGLSSPTTMTLDGYDDWIWGLAAVDGVLYVLDDWHDDATRVVAFDATTGLQVGQRELDATGTASEIYGYNGLYCEAR